MEDSNYVLVLISRVFNVLTGGSFDEPFCSRMWSKKQQGSMVGSFFVTILNRVFFLEENHCKDSYDLKEERHRKKAIKLSLTA